jgi:hypothetical protein
MPTQRRADLLVALSGIAAVQSNFATPMLEAAIDTAWPMTSDSYPDVQLNLDRILDCSQQDLIAKELLQRIMRFTMDFEADPVLLSVFAAYIMGIAAAPTGSTTNQVQTFTGTTPIGTWRIGVTVGGVVKYTQWLSATATATQVKTALENIAAIGRGNVLVAFASPVWTVTLQNNLAGAHLTPFVVDSTRLTSGTIVAAETAPGSQKSHALTRLTDFQPPAFGMAAGFRHSTFNMNLYKSVVADTMTIRGSHATPRVTASVGVAGSGEVTQVTDAYSKPVCQIYRPVRFRDCQLVINGVDYAANNLWRDFEFTFGNALITDDDAYASNEDISRLERADQRPWSLNVGILGEDGDDLFILGQEQAEVAVSLRIGRSGRNINFNVPKASVTLRGPAIAYDGTPKRSRIDVNIEPELIPGDATTPYTATANVPITQTFLTVPS